MIFVLSKVVQFIGMATVAVGLFVGLSQENSMMQELRLLLSGSVIFLAGWMLQKRSAS